MKKWRRVTIADVASQDQYALATGPFGSAISAKNFVDEGIPVIRGGNLSLDVGVRLKDDGLAFLTEAKAEKFKRSIARRGDLVFTCWGTVGQIGLIDDRSEYGEYVVSNKQMKLTPDSAKADSTFLYYLLSSPEMVRSVTGQAIGAAVPGFNLGQLKDLGLMLPPLEVQVCIAYVLNSIDDLIENHRRRVEVLEEMARAIYREWFVNFRYPGHEDVPLVDSALGPIPEGWEVRPVRDVSAVIVRGISPKYADDGEWIVLNQKCIRDGRVSFGPSRRQGRSVSDAKRIRSGDVLINSTGVGTLGRVAMYRGVSEGVTVDSHITICRPVADSLNPWFAMGMLAHQSQIQRLGVGATGQTELRKSDVEALELVQPVGSVVDAFAAAVRPILGQIDNLLAGNETVSALRDSLLPKLVTGQIDVSKLDLDGLIEEKLAS